MLHIIDYYKKMKKKSYYFLLTCFTLFSMGVYTQPLPGRPDDGLGNSQIDLEGESWGVRIGGNTGPHKSAVLDLNADNSAANATQGMVLPRVSSTATVSNPVEGLLVYSVASDGLCYYTGNEWKLLDFKQQIAPVRRRESGEDED
jgi:hypothetical protein